jgi:hypothetical protein
VSDTLTAEEIRALRAEVERLHGEYAVLLDAVGDLASNAQGLINSTSRDNTHETVVARMALYTSLRIASSALAPSAPGAAPGKDE